MAAVGAAPVRGWGFGGFPGAWGFPVAALRASSGDFLAVTGEFLGEFLAAASAGEFLACAVCKGESLGLAAGFSIRVGVSQSSRIKQSGCRV